MSTVYLAIQKSVEREVAIKVMAPSLNSDPNFGKRFYREAKIVGKMSHPNIVSIYDVGRLEKYHYITMDYLPGGTLPELVQQGITTKRALKICREIASALDYAHRQGFIHRDIKPDNILFRADGSAVLCDFGIAKAMKTDLSMTQVGSVLGTPHYMSPEQAQGKELDGRSDLYSLGVVLFEMLTGEVPYPGDDAIAVAVKHMSAPLPKLPNHIRGLQPLIDRLLAKKPVQRFQTGKELLDSMDSIEAASAGGDFSSCKTRSSTRVQVFTLIKALATTLGNAIALRIKRIVTPHLRNQNTVQLSEQELGAIDDFILEDKQPVEHASVVTRRVAPPALRRWIYTPLALLTGLVVSFIYLSNQHYSSLLMIYGQLDPTVSVVPTTANVPLTEQVAVEDNRQGAIPAQPVKRNAPALPTPVKPQPKPQQVYIAATPSHAVIKVLNIKPKFEQGMVLHAGNYHFKVSAPGYRSQRFWLKVAHTTLRHEITLSPLPPGSTFSDTLADGGNAPVLVILPAGNVNMGGENPYSVVLSKPLAMTETEVTFQQYDDFAKKTGRILPKDEGWGRGTRPVIHVSRDDALAYADWLSKQTGQHYRLPTAQEWEYGQRAGTSTFYWWQEESANDRANCRSGCNSRWSKLFSSSTGPAGSYPANSFGLYDTAGNVAEWLYDCTRSVNACREGLVAGGSHRDSVKNLQSHYREAVEAHRREDYIGIRLVRDL